MNRKELMAYAVKHLEVPGVAALLTHLNDTNLRISGLVGQLRVRVANADYNEKMDAFEGVDRLGADAREYDNACSTRNVLFSTLTTLLQEAGHKV